MIRSSLTAVRALPLRVVLPLAVFVAACAWAYWPTLAAMASRWRHEPQYAHGYLVPLFSLFLLWRRRKLLADARPQLNWWGLPLILLGCALRVAAAYLYFDWLDAASLAPCLLGVALLLGGRKALRWSWPAIAFLFFMIPLPFRVETAFGSRLQSLATFASTYALQTLGLPAVAEGNIIVLTHGRIGVAEACSGLSMLTTFFALATAVALFIDRPWIDRAVVVLSAAPIAVVANVARITVTALAQEWISPEAAHYLFHDLAGWLMMPLALVILWAELRLVSFLLVTPTALKPRRHPGRRSVPGRSPPEGRLRPPAEKGPLRRPRAAAAARAARPAPPVVTLIRSFSIRNRGYVHIRPAEAIGKRPRRVGDRGVRPPLAPAQRLGPPGRRPPPLAGRGRPRGAGRRRRRRRGLVLFAARALHRDGDVPHRVEAPGHALRPPGRLRPTSRTTSRCRSRLLKSHMVLNNALNQPGVAQIADVQKASDQVDWLEKQMHTDFSNGPEILRLTISSENNKDCKTLVDAVSSVYLKEVEKVANGRRIERQNVLGELVNKFEKNLKTLRADLRKQAEAAGTDDNQVLAVKQRIPYERALEIQRQLIEVETRLRTLKNEQALARPADPGTVEVSDRAVNDLVDKGPEIADLLKEKARQEAVIEVTAKEAAGGENHPAVVAMREKLNALKSEIEAERKALREDAKAQLRQAGAAAAAARATQLRDAIASNEALQKHLKSDIDQLENESKTLNKAALDIEDKKLEIAHAESDAARTTQELDGYPSKRTTRNG